MGDRPNRSGGSRWRGFSLLVNQHRFRPCVKPPGKRRRQRPLRDNEASEKQQGLHNADVVCNSPAVSRTAQSRANKSAEISAGWMAAILHPPPPMRIFGITKTGFTAIAIAVFALWGCIAMEAIALAHGREDARAVERMQRRPVPASVPVSPFDPAAVKSS